MSEGNAKENELGMYAIWETILHPSAEQVSYITGFIEPLQGRFTDLLPESELVVPNKSAPTGCFYGWAYCAYTKAKDVFMIYFEDKCEQAYVRALLPRRQYQLSWFNPVHGEWLAEQVILESDQRGRAHLPNFPGEQDWGVMLSLIER